MNDFISNLIKLLLKFIALLVVVYVGFVVVSMILNDIDERFLSDDEETPTEVVESASESETEPIVAPEPESMPKVNKEKKEKREKKENSPTTMFDAPRECVTSRSLKVVDIFNSRYVIAKELFEGLEEYGATTDLTVVFIDEDNTYYTDQIITIPRGKCARQIGIYKSDHYMYDDKILPVVKIMDK